jgi:polyhydroxyalkanoate synthesis repressor PhaR
MSAGLISDTSQISIYRRRSLPTIKRYPNRKLYNTETKQYITLDELADLIRGGDEIHVIDNASGEDLTALTMTQVLFEQVKKQAGFLPRTLLAGLIQAGGEQLSSLQRSLASSLGLWRQTDEEIQRRIQALIEHGELSEEEGLNLLEKLMRRVELKPEASVPDEEFVARVLEEHGVATQGEVQKLIEQIEILNARLDAASQANAQPPKDVHQD